MRNLAVDNIKLLMVFLVVFGHIIEPIIEHSELIKLIYMFIYSFHMPVFIIMAGAFTKIDVSERQVVRHIETLFIPLLVFTLLYEVFNLTTEASISHYTANWQPYWLLWFLLSLFIWKVTLPFVMQLRFPFLISLAVSLCAGYVDEVGYFLGISRTLYFFPFFILGHYLGAGILKNKNLMVVPKVAYFLLLIINILVIWLVVHLPHEWWYGSVSYSGLMDAGWYSFIFRLAAYLISFISAIAILMLLRDWKCSVFQRGHNSFFVYVWHGFFLKLAVFVGGSQILASVSSSLSLLIALVISVLLTYLLSSQVVASATNNLLLTPARSLLLNQR